VFADANAAAPAVGAAVRRCWLAGVNVGANKSDSRLAAGRRRRLGFTSQPLQLRHQ